MFKTTDRLNFSGQDLDVIERALQAQSKILSLQARAGDNSALRRLNDVTRILARLERDRPEAIETIHRHRGFNSISRVFC
ncbi:MULTISPECIES: hypothetical protein [Roseovarius]|uniref:Uncharacterized protein n=1 Tax=Roseovarius lutimaris TaxID=1005928 RepID=A0A1I5FPX2_9RHOB|nr:MULTISPECIES: hypothetical protein [Roseovarius]KJS42352.1 MAG: hypothetical protein VR71_14840 [Roseovarius sp. BRH_c41]SFO25676.1 hypothetical protein SAMN04487859_12122 [Roseovarius lutimaris]|tara:strand:- start:14657 stop:14896 length:240 start_codon:yes stop_codon:yes gene_type:complete